MSLPVPLRQILIMLAATFLMAGPLFCPQASGAVLDDFSRGIRLLQERRFADAVAAFSLTIEADAGNARAYNNRGVCHFYLGDLDRAITDYTDAIRLDPAFAEAYKNRGGAWFYKKAYQDALADYSQALALEPDDAQAYYYRAVNRFFLGEYELAIDDYSHALYYQKDFAAAYNQVAWILATCPEERLRDGALALEMVEKALALQSDVEFYDTLAAAYAELGRFEEAVEAQQRAVSMLKAGDDPQLLETGLQRLAHYRSGRPWREKGTDPETNASVAVFVETWRRSWEDGDLAAYLRCYHPDAVQGSRRGAQQIGAHKQRLWQGKSPGRIRIDGIAIHRRGSAVRVTFRQRYEREDGYVDIGTKTLDLAPYGTDWRILRESWHGGAGTP